jgi:hypothetical protein
MILYELESRAALDKYLKSDAVIRLRADHYARFGSSTRLSRMLLTPIAAIEKDKPMPRTKKVVKRNKPDAKKSAAKKRARQ